MYGYKHNILQSLDMSTIVNISTLINNATFESQYSYLISRKALPLEPTLIGHNVNLNYEHHWCGGINRVDLYEERRIEFENKVYELFNEMAPNDKQYVDFLEWILEEIKS